MNTAQLKALLKKNGLTIGTERVSSITRAYKPPTQGIHFDWEDVEGGHRCAHASTPTHTVNETDQVLVLVSRAREGVLTGPSAWGEKQAAEDADKLAQVLKDAGLDYKRKGLSFTLPSFTRVLEEGWGKRTDGRHSARYRNFKRVRYPETAAAAA